MNAIVSLFWRTLYGLTNAGYRTQMAAAAKRHAEIKAQERLNAMPRIEGKTNIPTVNKGPTHEAHRL